MEACRCGKPPPLCVCRGQPRLENRHPVFILQHPREPSQTLGTASLVEAFLTRVTRRVGLSIPGLRSLLPEVVYGRWLVLYPPGRGAMRRLDKPIDRPAVIGISGEDREIPLNPQQIDGLVLLDGSWPQTKSLWWRNPWLLKLRRGLLLPPKPSSYGKLRREPRSTFVSTLEAVAWTLQWLGEGEVADFLLERLEEFLKKVKRGGLPPG